MIHIHAVLQRGHPKVARYPYYDDWDHDDSAYACTYYDGLGMIAYRGNLFKLHYPDVFHELHKESSVFVEYSFDEFHELVLVQLDPVSWKVKHKASASKGYDNFHYWGADLSGPITMPALVCIQRFFQKHVQRLLSQRKFAAFQNMKDSD